MFSHVMVGVTDIEASKRFYDQADAWHAAGVANGGTSIEDPPGRRENGMYLAYLRDPDGSKICALLPPS